MRQLAGSLDLGLVLLVLGAERHPRRHSQALLHCQPGDLGIDALGGVGADGVGAVCQAPQVFLKLRLAGERADIRHLAVAVGAVGVALDQPFFQGRQGQCLDIRHPPHRPALSRKNDLHRTRLVVAQGHLDRARLDRRSTHRGSARLSAQSRLAAIASPQQAAVRQGNLKARLV